MSRENLRKVYGDDPTSWPTNPADAYAPGPQGYGDAEDAAELRALNGADRDQERENAAEQGVGVAEYRDMIAADAARQARIARRVADGTYTREAAAEQVRMRRESGLPDGVLPTATFSRSNGELRVFVGDLVIDGPFTVGADGVPTGPGVHRRK